jgi:hypothetical protein
MPESLTTRLWAENKTIMDIVQQGLTTGVIRIDSQATKKALADIVAALLVAGAGITITYSESAGTITITSP